MEKCIDCIYRPTVDDQCIIRDDWDDEIACAMFSIEYDMQYLNNTAHINILNQITES